MLYCNICRDVELSYPSFPKQVSKFFVTIIHVILFSFDCNMIAVKRRLIISNELSFLSDIFLNYRDEILVVVGTKVDGYEVLLERGNHIFLPRCLALLANKNQQYSQQKRSTEIFLLFVAVTLSRYIN